MKYLSNFPKDYFEIPIFYINKIEQTSSKKSHSKYLMEISTKDNRNLRFNVFNEEKTLYNHLHKLSNPKEFTDFLKYTMRYRESHPVNNDGWRIYKMKNEFKRQGVVLGMDNFVNELEKTKKEEEVFYKLIKIIYLIFRLNFVSRILILISNFVKHIQEN